VNDGRAFGIQHIGLDLLKDHRVPPFLHTVTLRRDLTEFIFVM
jgi:hypothetical protein